MLTTTDFLHWIERCAHVIAEQRDYLVELDAAIGDADHGANMDRGFQAVLQKLAQETPGDCGALLKLVAMTLISTVGGAAGPLYGTFFLQMATKLAGKGEVSAEEWAIALEAAVQGVQQRGKAEPGDKTMLDALAPAVVALRASLVNGKPFAEALQAAAQAAEQGMKETIPLVARKGRASYLGERSAGHQDPGATSAYYLLQAAADSWSGID
ncbi:MAG: Phosphoenolpyruvate-dihydroxyacetone phosphotransferase [Anaerolineae bacterium]|jgi:dihydroxyacetone kinase-like protein|nr:MAG: Phosphoenolpyruvate-dihydroxyacetone phosphotransferase [Anaerolineae bacterium]